MVVVSAGHDVRRVVEEAYLIGIQTGVVVFIECRSASALPRAKRGHMIEQRVYPAIDG